MSRLWERSWREQCFGAPAVRTGFCVTASHHEKVPKVYGLFDSGHGWKDLEFQQQNEKGVLNHEAQNSRYLGPSVVGDLWVA